MVRKIVAALILAPIAVGFAAFAVANRQTIVVSLDPFDHATPALAVAIPLFALVLALLIVGVAVALGAWLGAMLLSGVAKPSNIRREHVAMLKE